MLPPQFRPWLAPPISSQVRDGEEIEDWIYGQPPGKITFVTFQGDKVIRVKETYAGLGTEAPKLPVPR